MFAHLARLALGLTVFLGLISADPIRAQSYPTKPVRIIVPYPAGGGVDAVARIIANKLPELLGSQVYVENLPGAGGTIGTGTAARAPADGHTLLFINPDFIVQPVIKAKVPYDPFESFVPVSLIGIAPEVVAVAPSLPVRTMRELIDLLQRNPGKYNFATPGYGTSPHLASERLLHLTHGLDVVHVPFQGAAPAIASTIAGHTSILHMTMSTLAPHLEQGTLRALAVASAQRSPAFPEIATLQEAGIPDHEVDYFVGLMAPAQTPPAIIDLLRRQIAAIIALPQVRQRLIASGLELAGPDPEEFSRRLRVDHAAWTRVVREANIKLQ